MSTRDELAEVIAAHAYDTGWRCTCGWTGTASEYDAHVADALLPVVTRMLANAWDERDNARPQYLGPQDGHYEDCVGWGDCYCASHPNPYRTTHQLDATEQRENR